MPLDPMELLRLKLQQLNTQNQQTPLEGLGQVAGGVGEILEKKKTSDEQDQMRKLQAKLLESQAFKNFQPKRTQEQTDLDVAKTGQIGKPKPISDEEKALIEARTGYYNAKKGLALNPPPKKAGETSEEKFARSQYVSIQKNLESTYGKIVSASTKLQKFTNDPTLTKEIDLLEEHTKAMEAQLAGFEAAYPHFKTASKIRKDSPSLSRASSGGQTAPSLPESIPQDLPDPAAFLKAHGDVPARKNKKLWRVNPKTLKWQAAS